MKTTDRRTLSVVYRVTSRMLRPGLLWWCLLMFVLGLAVVLFYGLGDVSRTVFTPLCPEADVETRTLDWWLNIELFSWLPLITGLFGVMAICRGVAGLLDDGSIEMLMAGPISPRSFLWGRYLPVAIGLLLLHLAVTGGMVIGFAVLDVTPEPGPYVAVILHSLLLSLVMTAAGLLISVLTGRLGSAMAYGMGALLLSFVYDLAVRAAGAPDGWRMITPFGYYSSCEILIGAGGTGLNLIYLSGWLALIITSALHIFATRDLV